MSKHATTQKASTVTQTTSDSAAPTPAVDPRLLVREQGFAETGPVKGIEAIAVSRADNVTAANLNNKNTWKAPVIASKVASNTQFADKEQVR